MKKTILLAVAFGFIASGTAFAAGDSVTGSFNTLAGHGITGTKHDLSALNGLTQYAPVNGSITGGDPLDRICIWCHAPHHSMKITDAANIKYLPLWNHEVTVEDYDTYKSDWGDGPVATNAGGFADRHLLNATTAGSLGQPGGVSRLCLSCHDGTIAVNEYGRTPQREYSQSNGTKMIDAQFMIGGQPYGLVNHHPIGFNYVAVAAVDDEIASPSVAIGSGMTTIATLLYKGTQMECVTCHDVHNSKNTGETFLWKSDKNSEFCLTCHLK